jgi:hypothetical protein
MDRADEIWNRAALHEGGPAPSEGDRALAAALHLHSAAMSGGVLDAVETMSAEELDAAEAGFRWLHVPTVAELLSRVRRQVAEGVLEDAERAARLEFSAEDEYHEAIENDAALEAAFKARLRTDPTAFSPAEQRPRT